MVHCTCIYGLSSLNQVKSVVVNCKMVFLIIIYFLLFLSVFSDGDPGLYSGVDNWNFGFRIF